MEHTSLTHGRFTYDPTVDALFVRIPGDYKVSIRQKGFTIDINPKGAIIAVEILDASKVLGIAQEVLEHHDRWECRVKAQEKTISVEFTFAVRTGAEVHAALNDKAKVDYPETRMAVSAE